MIAKGDLNPFGWHCPRAHSKKPWLFFCQSNGHVFQTLRTKLCQESEVQRSDLDSAESQGTLDAAIASHTCRDGMLPSLSFKPEEWLNSTPAFGS